ncbi:LOW QUALITY PROTEIN: NAD-specific glutamate dehydrogenase [Geomicrobium sp. JCM 19039]|nr:LOW QUALITY PROTEIN: NAD-specific glutamate dehydrogenase [Geomicrobium sp. JCM 19039]
MNSRLEAFQQIVSNALSSFGYSSDLTKILTSPFRTYKVSIPVKMDDGSTEVFTGYRVQHNDAAGSAIGSVILHPTFHETDVQALAIRTSLQAGMLDLPYSGASGALICNPSELSYQELEQLSRGYVRAVLPLLSATKDVITPEIPTTANIQLMSWMYDELLNIKPDNATQPVAGRAEALGGIKGRDTRLPKAHTIVLKPLLRKTLICPALKLSFTGLAIRGHIRRELKQLGVLLSGVSDGHGALYDADGLDIDYLLDRRDSFGMVTNLFRKSISKERLLSSECDILIDASIHKDTMTEKAVSSIQAKVIVETAKQTLNNEATEILRKNGKLIVPEILSGLGNLALSALEQQQDYKKETFTEDEVNERLNASMKHAFMNTYHLSNTEQINMREAAYMIGIRKHADAFVHRGWS